MITYVDTSGNFISNVGEGLLNGEPVELPAAPDGALIADIGAPTNSLAVLTGFSVSEGRATGGSWNYSAVPVPPDVTGFIQAAKAALGGVAALVTMGAYGPMAIAALQAGEWADFVTLITAGKNAAPPLISGTQYTALQALVLQYNLPSAATLP